MAKRLGSFYHKLSLTITNTIVILIVFNLLLAAIYAVSDAIYTYEPADRMRTIDPETLLSVYPGWSLDELYQLANESSLPFICDDDVGFREQPRTGKYVTVTEAGYRLSGKQLPWPIDDAAFTVFVFGGSTTFGYNEVGTIPSHMQALIPNANIYNFGFGHGYNSLELKLFLKLVQSGNVPDVVVFIDGLNDLWHIPDNPPRYDPNQCLEWPLVDEPPLLPFQRAIRDIHRVAYADEPRGLPVGDNAVYEQIIQRYMTNREIIKALAEQFGIKTVFVWQPIPSYGYDLSYHPFMDERNEYMHLGYAYFAEMRGTWSQWDDFLYLADLLEDYDRPAFVDAVHYTSEVTKMIADRIAQFISE